MNPPPVNGFRSRTYWHQFKISRVLDDPCRALPGFRFVQVGSWWVHAHESLPVHDLVDGAGKVIGCVLGWPLISGNIPLPGSQITISPIDGATVRSGSEGDWPGRWLSLRTDLETVRIDALGTLAAVYTHSDQLVASTALLLRPDLEASIRLGEYPDSAPDLYFPCGLTAFDGVCRLLPNHELRLAGMRAERYWPKGDLLQIPENDGKEICRAAVLSVRRNLLALVAASNSLVCGLTGGRDSRVLLAAMTDSVRERTTFVTYKYPGRPELGRDVSVAKRLARRLSLRHRVLTVTESGRDGRLEYLKRIGLSGGSGKVRDFHDANLPYCIKGCSLIAGFGGEVAVAYFCRSGDDKRFDLRPAELLRLFNLPDFSPFRAAVANWMQGFEGRPSNATLIEAFYIENRVGSWSAPHAYGFAPFPIYSIPFSDPVYRDLCLSLPLAFRKSRASQISMIDAVAPELLDVPFERFLGFDWVREKLVRNRFYRLA